jgi:hypothetical protein
VLFEIMSGFRVARSHKIAFRLTAAMPKPISRCATPMQRPLGDLASLAKVDDVTHPVPPR